MPRGERQYHPNPSVLLLVPYTPLALSRRDDFQIAGAVHVDV